MTKKSPTDRRNPTVNANGLIFGATEESTDLFPVLDPVIIRRPRSRWPVRDPKDTVLEG